MLRTSIRTSAICSSILGGLREGVSGARERQAGRGRRSARIATDSPTADSPGRDMPSKAAGFASCTLIKHVPELHVV